MSDFKTGYGGGGGAEVRSVTQRYDSLFPGGGERWVKGLKEIGGGRSGRARRGAV